MREFSGREDGEGAYMRCGVKLAIAFVFSSSSSASEC